MEKPPLVLPTSAQQPQAEPSSPATQRPGLGFIFTVKYTLLATQGPKNCFPTTWQQQAFQVSLASLLGATSTARAKVHGALSMSQGMPAPALASASALAFTSHIDVIVVATTQVLGDLSQVAKWSSWSCLS